ncbi:MAG TPA: DNA-3-methyladenine glycosylase 2 family protein [Thermoanaerobaculia bacterium]|nr:DNA-3-methyladenine glycosylase 2 family protein [Thermoanaerobaculia bacterium]
MTLDYDVCYRAIRSRDSRFDGRFFTAVRTTGIYCRPVCPARTPRKENVDFFSEPAAAEEAGFRPCLRCRPEVAPSTPAWAGSSAVVGRALRLIAEGALDRAGINELARRLGVGARQLRRLFIAHVGTTPIAVAQTRRVHFARTLIESTRLPMIDVALGSGFSSVRRFNVAMQQTYGRTPSEIRVRQPASASSEQSVELKLTYRPPFSWNTLAAFLASRAIPGVEIVGGNYYSRTIRSGSDHGVVSVRYLPATSHLILSAPSQFGNSIRTIANRARALFDLGADLEVISEQLRRDPLLASLIDANPGVRIPGAWDPFELSVRAIVGQQVSVKGASTIMGRIANRYGERIEGADDRFFLLFPRPEVLADAVIEGMPSSRARAIRGLARVVADGTLRLESGSSLEETIEKLVSLPGIGPWTAHYIAMRTLGEPDAFPHNDLGLRKAAGAGITISGAELLSRAEAWRPWRGYAAMLLWSSLP